MSLPHRAQESSSLQPGSDQEMASSVSLPALDGAMLGLPVDRLDALDGLWSQIHAALDEDAHSELAEGVDHGFDRDAASAYVDQEGFDRDERQLFERKLGQDKQLSEWVSDAQTVSDWIKSYAYRLETQCGFDYTLAVMNRYNWPEEPSSQLAVSVTKLSESDWQLLQPWHDEQSLDSEQTEFMRLLLRYEPQALEALTGLQTLANVLLEYQHRLMLQAPELGELAIKRLVRENRAKPKVAVWVGKGARIAVATLLLTFVSFNVFGWLEHSPYALTAGETNQAIASGLIPGMPVSYGRAALETEPGEASGWAQGGPDGPYSDTVPAVKEAGADSAPQLIDSQSMQPPSSEDYLMNLQNRDYSLNEYELSVDL